LTSHFAGNKVTLFDFQLAEHMNQQFAVTQRWFIQYPIISSKSWASIKIFFATFVLVGFAFQLGSFWGNYYPSAAQRGEKPQAAHNNPYLVGNFYFDAGALHSDSSAELYAKSHVDDFSFKRAFFLHKNIW
jgi:hypothetical protein